MASPSGPGATSAGSQVHAAAVNGDRSALLRLITADPSLRDHEDQFGRTPLMYCVLADRLDCAEILLKAGALVNKTDHSQRTALHLSAQKGNVRFLKLLLSRRANWLQKDLEEMTPLHLATRHPSPKALALLLKHIGPGEVDTQDKNKQTALHWSAFYNRPEHVRLLIKHDSNIGIPDNEGKIPLHWAAHSQESSATQTVRCILEAAPTESLLNWQDYEGRTPLHFAVADGNEAVVELLTSYKGCNVTAYDNLFRTPLHWAALLGHARIVHMLLERNTSGTIPSDSQGATPLHYGAQSNNAETVGVFLSHPSVKDEPDLEGRTAFMWAAGKGSDDALRTMLALTPRIDINMADKYGGTALHAASLSGHVTTVKLLLEEEAMVDSLDVMKHTPLFRACEMGHRDVILTLIQGSARVSLVDVDGHTVLHWAALGGNAEVCQILMENGISPNVQDQAGRTPLQCAAYGGYITCMAVLMENNADPNIQDKEGRTALHWSCNNGYLDAVKLLLGCSAFPNHMEHTEERYTPLDYALLGGHSEVTQFMLEHGALSIAAIQDIAAASIQAIYKGYTVRKAFRERKQLLMRHEQLRKDAAKKREEEQRRRDAVQHVSVTDKQSPPVAVGAEQEATSLAAMVEDLTMSACRGPSRSKGERRRAVCRARPSTGSNPPGLKEAPFATSFHRPGNAEASVSQSSSSSSSGRLKPRPPATPRVREPTSGPAGQTDGSTSRRRRMEGHLGVRVASAAARTDGKPTSPRPRDHEDGTPTDQAPPLSARSCPSVGHKTPQRKARPPPLKPEGGERHLAHERAARTIQRAWRRFHARHREAESPEGAEPREATPPESRTKKVASATNQSRSSLLQSIYGSSAARRGRSQRNAQHQPLFDLPHRTRSQLSSIDCVPLTEAVIQATHFSYHLRPCSASRGSRGRGKH